MLLTLEPTLLNSSETEHYRSNHQSPTNVRDIVLHGTFAWPPSSQALCIPPRAPPHTPSLCLHLDTFLGNLRCQAPKTPHLSNRRRGQASGEWVRKEETRGEEAQRRTAGTGERCSVLQGEFSRVESIETACSLLRWRGTKEGTGKGLDLIG